MLFPSASLWRFLSHSVQRSSSREPLHAHAPAWKFFSKIPLGIFELRRFFPRLRRFVLCCQRQPASPKRSAATADRRFCGMKGVHTYDPYRSDDRLMDRIAKTSAATLAAMTDWRQALDHASGKDKTERKASELPADIVGGWYTVQWSAPADRVQIIFHKFPIEEARKIVKDAGFYWSPSLKCWQRRITRKAERAAYDASAKLAALHLH